MGLIIFESRNKTAIVLLLLKKGQLSRCNLFVIMSVLPLQKQSVTTEVSGLTYIILEYTSFR